MELVLSGLLVVIGVGVAFVLRLARRSGHPPLPASRWQHELGGPGPGDGGSG